jgi:hypothetical protein
MPLEVLSRANATFMFVNTIAHHVVGYGDRYSNQTGRIHTNGLRGAFEISFFNPLSALFERRPIPR